jgi:CRP-like cAMP-binding protein
MKFGTLHRDSTLHETGALIRYVYFLDEGMISLVLNSKKGVPVEVGVVGCEGIAGMEAATKTRAISRAMVQIAGNAWQLPASHFATAAKGGTMLQELTIDYWQFLAAQNSQAALCNRLHTIEQRLCRWLLLVRDRVGSNEFFLTQEFLSQMLGVQRPGVSVAAGMLRTVGLIDYTRGHIKLLDIPRLEKIACECHAVLHERYVELVNSTPSSYR